MNGPRILVVRLGSMGDVIHTLPAVASLKHSLPHADITWLVEPRWAPLLDGNACLSGLCLFDRSNLRTTLRSLGKLRSQNFDFAVDFQGLVKSAFIASLARTDRIYGFDRRAAREPAASWFYSDRIALRNYHAVERNLDLAAGAGATKLVRHFPLPAGQAEGTLPDGPFVLANPLAGWGAKQWPFDNYAQLGALLRRETGLALVVNAATPVQIPNTVLHVSSLSGLIYATRRAAAVVGVDSGPLHLAAALRKPGVGIYGPTEPARHGPYGGSIVVLRAADAEITYRRSEDSAASMRSISPEMVLAELVKTLQPQPQSPAQRGA